MATTPQHKQPTRRLLVTLLVAITFAWAAACQAQTVSRPRVQRGPHYVGQPVVIQIALKAPGAAGVQPSCKLAQPAPDGVRVAKPQVSQSVSSFTQIINGRVSSEETINYRFSFVVTADAEGTYQIGPFDVEYDGNQVQLDAVKLSFQQLSSDNDMFIEVELPQGEVYVGQRIPVTVKWGFAGANYEVVYAFRNLSIRSPLFEQFSFDDQQPRTRTTLSFDTQNGTVEVDATESSERRDGRTYVVLTCQRMMVAEAVGDFRELPVACYTKRGIGWRNDLFGRVSPTRDQPAFTAGGPVDLQVKALPAAGRPASFAGAVGSGFSLDVTANRSVVRVGDPISLTVSVRGEGVEKMSLPDLTADGGMDPNAFQLPAELPSGTVADHTKQFNVSVRVKDESVQQIPALAFSWFDPQQETYQTAHSKPIALQVMPAQMISADAVVSAAPTGTDAETPDASPATTASVGTPRSTVLQGANLAIETDPARLSGQASGGLGVLGPRGMQRAWQLGSYGVGVLALLGAWGARRRADIDPQVRQQLQQRQQIRADIKRSATVPGRAGVEQLAAGLRAWQAQDSGPQQPQLNDIIRQCEDTLYAPADVSVSAAELVKQALPLLDKG